MFVAFALAAPAAVWADTGFVRLSETAGLYRVTLLTNPTPLYAGPLEFSVYVQDAHTLAPVTDALVDVQLEQIDGPDALAKRTNINIRSSEATRLLPSPLVGEGSGVRGPHYAGRSRLPHAGQWRLTLSIDSPAGQATAACELKASAPPARWATFWPWISLPAAVMLLYAIREYTQSTRQQVRDAIGLEKISESTPQ